MAEPLIVVWRVTERCNQACDYCAFDHRLARPRAEISEPDARRFVQLLGDLRERTGRDLLLSWLGGEPMLWPALETMTGLAVERGLRVSLTSNGLAFTRARWRDFAVANLSELTLSIDGAAAVHDRFRNRPGQGAELLEVLRALRALRDRTGAPLVLKVNTVLMRANVDGFEAFTRALADAGADVLTFNPLGGNDRPEFHARERLTAEQIERFAKELPRIQRESRARGLEILGSGAYLARLRSTARGERLAVGDCLPGTSFWFIDAQGRLSPCSFTSEGYALSIHGLRDVDALLAVPEKLAALRRAVRHGACGDCQATHQFAKFEAVPA